MNWIEQSMIFAGETFVLNNQRSMYWPKYQRLILSDLHLGKSAHFRKHGFAIPNILHQNDLYRLQQLIHHYQPKQLIIVGDFLHAGENKEVFDWNKYIQQYPDLQVILIKGNHDKLTDEFFQKLHIHSIYTQWIVNGICFTHQPHTVTDIPTISGHYHPGIQLTLLKNSRKSFPCFAIEDNQLILPAFSQFTGLDTKLLKKNGKYFGFHSKGFFCV